MTATPAENLQRLLTASWEGWASVVGAWQRAVMDVYAAVAEWAYEEDEHLGFGEAEVFVSSSTATGLTARLVRVDVEDQQQRPAVPSTDVTLTPDRIPATTGPEGVRVVVRIHATKGAYFGVLVDDSGATVEPDVYVSVG